MKDTKITCDYCGDDLSTTGSMPKFRLSLSSESVPSNSDIRCAVIVYPPISRECHFCNKRCLERWIDGDAVDAAAQERGE